MLATTILHVGSRETVCRISTLYERCIVLEDGKLY